MNQVDVEDQVARHAARRVIGELAWPTVVLGGVVTIAYLLTPVLVAYGFLSALAAIPLMMLITYAAYTVLHESVHGSISGSQSEMRWLNELLGYCAGWVMMIPLTAHRHEHLAHHRNTNGPDDPDALIADMARSPVHAIRAAANILVSQYLYYLRHRWQVAPRSQNIRFCLEIAVIILLRIAIITQVGWFSGAIILLAGNLGGVMLVMYLFAYIVHRPHEAVGRYVDTSTFVVPGLTGKFITVLWGFQNYHAIHHLFPRVPFYRYRQLFNEIEPVLIAKGTLVYSLTLSGLERLPAAVDPAGPSVIGLDGAC